MLRQMRHDVWATTQLFVRCRTLTKEQWQLTAPGTYDTIQKTFAHIVRANEGYLNPTVSSRRRSSSSPHRS